MISSNGAQPKILISSPCDQELLTYSLAIVRGTTTSELKSVYISSGQGCGNVLTEFPVREKHFTAVYQLSPGANSIVVSADESMLHSAQINLFYTPPPETPPYVRLVYLLAADSDGSFQSPESNSTRHNVTSGTSRLHTAGLLIQSATAEMLHAHGLQRRTFSLKPSVYVHRCTSFTTEQAFEMHDSILWQNIERELSECPERDDVIDLAVISFSRVVDGKVKAHTALGGGTLALFGGASMFTWPERVSEISKSFLDASVFDDERYFDDSAGRMCLMGRRACAATTIGALLHEVGHCLTLRHPCGDANRNGGGIMSRGFDNFDRLFVQPASSEVLPFWDRGSALRLRYHRFLQFSSDPAVQRMRSFSAEPRPSPSPVVRENPSEPSNSLPIPVHSDHRQEHAANFSDRPPFFECTAGSVVCRSWSGLGHLGYYLNEDNAAHEDFAEAAPTEFCVPSLPELRVRCKAEPCDTIVLSAIDVSGRITEFSYEDF